MYNSEEIKKLLLEIENETKVCTWTHNGYFIWPVLRIFIYMTLVNEDRSFGVERNKKNILFKIKKIVLSLKEFKLLGSKKINNLYVGAPSYTVNYNGFQYNKYFDSLMDADKSSSLYISRSDSKNGVYKPGRHLTIYPIGMVFSMIDKIFGSYSSPTHHIQEICNILSSKGIQIVRFEEILKKRVRTVDLFYSIFLFLFKKLNPKRVWVLCYYTADMLGMLIAAHKLSIPTIDFQHGGQGEIHLAYSNWTNVPRNGYEALPDIFHTWDEPSAEIINSWAKVNKKHSAKVYGNPWIEGWKKESFHRSKTTWPENLILYTLQPIDEPLEEYILKAIQKTKHKWNWWLRLHPRQTGEKAIIIQRLKKFEVFDSVEIELASNLPLPEILLHSRVHITKFSGSAFEAYEFDIPSLIIDQRGKDTYQSYINSGDNMFTLKNKDSDSLIFKLKEFI